MFKSTSATQQTIATGGKTLPNITWQGVGSSYLCSDAINTGATAVLTLTNGILDLNGKSHSVGLFSITGASARTLTFNAAAITIKGIGNAWNATTTTNLTFTPDTGSITMTGNGSVLGACNFIGGGLTYNTVAFTNTGISNLQSANTFATLTFTGGASASTEYRVSANQTISGTLTLNGTTVAQRAVIRSNTLGTQRTLTAATVSSNGFFDLMDIIGAGAGTWSNTGWGVYNVSGITGATPVTTYYVGGTGNSNDATKYSSTNGGTANTQRAPLLQDTAIYNGPDGKLHIEVVYQAESVWLTQKRMAELFDVDVRTVNEHLQNIYDSEELSISSTIRNFRIVQNEGGREVKRDINFYNLDAIISVGYRRSRSHRSATIG